MIRIGCVNFPYHSRMLLMCGVAALLVAGCSARSAGAPDSVCNDPDMVPTTHVSTFSATGVQNANQYALTAKPEPNRPGVIRGGSLLCMVV